MRGEVNKRHNQRIKRRCPVCGGRVIIAHRNSDWWVACEENSFHITQKFYAEPINAIRAWNGCTNADKLRAMSDEELAEFLTTEDMCELICAPAPPHCDGQCKQKMLDWLRQEA